MICLVLCLRWGFTAHSTQSGHVERGQFTLPHFYWACFVLSAVNQYCAHSFARNLQLPFLNQGKGVNDRREYFMTNTHENMLSTRRGWGRGVTRNLLVTSRTPLRSASTLLHWLILYNLAYPEVQRMVQLEIDNLVGDERKVVLNDRSKLHYTPVTILEVMRVSNIAPLAWSHSTTIDIKLNGYETDTLRKHAYSNILKILPPKAESFQRKILIFFIYLLKTQIVGTR